ncbi:FAD binding domain-containing protein [Falsiroseomonas tokyonensis]|uniref:FAD binding domain-containing protein n=1 Tax=Falsiroseomonas tokyonensis TaxID=430521 RepID=A0ABV7C4C1_9PROT|nr:FAD binding domain-containing protein [Falsiroseomonas tokyonensis]MBU8541147.1 FAD binding domain-containing protein [Falsiroseomonas tokyonensis]
MIPAPFTLRRTADWDALPALLEDALPLGGGQSLMPLLALRLAEPAALVPLRDLPGLSEIAERDGALWIGAGVTHARIEDGIGPVPLREWLSLVASGIAYRPVRNLGTLGGSLALHDPASDWPVALLALGASAVLRQGDMRRVLLVEKFCTGAFATALQPGEVIEAVTIPIPATGTRFGWCKLAPAPGAFAEALAGVLHAPGAAPRIAVASPAGARLMPEAPPPDDPHLARLRDVAIRRAGA